MKDLHNIQKVLIFGLLITNTFIYFWVRVVTNANIQQNSFFSLVKWDQIKLQGQDGNSEYRINLTVIALIAFCQGLLGISDLFYVLIQSDNFELTQRELHYMRHLIAVPWIIKPLWGFCSDIFPLFQYRRKSYLLVFGLMGFVFENILGLFELRDKYFAFACLFMVQMSIVCCNVVGEALIVENSGMKHMSRYNISDEQLQTSATRNVTVFFGMKAAGTLVYSLTQPYLGREGTSKNIRLAFSVTSFLPLTMGLSALFLQEKKVSENQSFKTVKKSTKYTLIEFFAFIRQPGIYKYSIGNTIRPILFILCFMATPSPATAMFYFYINGLKLEDTFFIDLKFAYSITTILAMIMFYYKLRHIPFKSIFSFANIWYFIASLFALVLVTRINISYGISDYQFCMGDNILMQVVSQFNTIPVLVLACKMCPINVEATMYSILMASINLGGVISQSFGAWLTHYLGVTNDKFDNLWILILVTNFASQLPMPFIGAVSEEDVARCQRRHDSKEDETLTLPNSDEQQRLQKYE